MRYQDQLYATYECPELGEIVYDRGKFCICKLGVCEKKRNKLCSPGVCKKKKNVLWDDIDKIYIFALKTYVYFVPASESISLNLVNQDGSRLSLGVSSGVRLKQEEKNLMDKVYSYVVSQVFNRQWNELTTELNRGQRVSFGSFDLTSDVLYRKKLFGYEAIELAKILNCQYYTGEFGIQFHDDKGRLRRKTLNRVAQIPNIHLVEALLKHIVVDKKGISKNTPTSDTGVRGLEFTEIVDE